MFEYFFFFCKEFVWLLQVYPKYFYNQKKRTCVLSNMFMRTWQLVEGVPKTLQLVWWLHVMEPSPASSGCSEWETGKVFFTTTEIINTLHIYSSINCNLNLQFQSTIFLRDYSQHITEAVESHTCDFSLWTCGKGVEHYLSNRHGAQNIEEDEGAVSVIFTQKIAMRKALDVGQGNKR